VGERAERLEQFAGGPHRTGHHHRPRCSVGHTTGQLRSTLGEFEHAVLGVVQFQTLGAATEAVGEDDVGAGVDELLVQADHTLGVLEIPEFGWMPGGEPDGEIVGTGGAIGQQHIAGGEQLGERGAHRVSRDGEPQPSEARR